jgi:hypothetical protein
MKQLLARSCAVKLDPLRAELVGLAPIYSLDRSARRKIKIEEVENTTRHAHGVAVEVFIADRVRLDTVAREPVLPRSVVLVDRSTEPVERARIKVGLWLWRSRVRFDRVGHTLVCSALSHETA